jgi:hypothetical protein
MKITEREFNLLAKLQNQIKEKMEISVGFSLMYGAFVNEADQFIAYEDVDSQYYLFHKHDMYVESIAFMVRHQPSTMPCHDDEAAEFLATVRQALKTGKIQIPPSITETYQMPYGGEIKVKVSKDCEFYSIKIERGTVSTGFMLRKGDKSREHNDLVQKTMELYDKEFPDNP